MSITTSITNIPTDIYQIMFSFLSPREMTQLSHCSKELKQFGKTYISKRRECILCHDEWIKELDSIDEIFPDLDNILHQDEIMERLAFIARLGYYKRATFFCKTCQTVIWNNETIFDLRNRISISIQFRIVPSELPWVYMYHTQTIEWSPLCMDLFLYSLSDE